MDLGVNIDCLGLCRRVRLDPLWVISGHSRHVRFTLGSGNMPRLRKYFKKLCDGIACGQVQVVNHVGKLLLPNNGEVIESL